MFKVGDYIIYGVSGVCRVENIGLVKLAELPKDKLYYTLQPVYTKGSTIFCPVENQKVKMRPVLTESEAKELIDEMKDLDTLWIADDRNREACFKEVVRSCDCRQLVKLIKTIYQVKLKRLEEGKKLNVTDERYFHMAEESLYGELAIPLHRKKEEIAKVIEERVKKLEQSEY